MLRFLHRMSGPIWLMEIQPELVHLSAVHYDNEARCLGNVFLQATKNRHLAGLS